jgi:hypothetical protein
MTAVLALLGTRKGAFILEGDGDRRRWDLRGPFCEAWPINHVTADPATGVIWAAGGSAWFGPAVWRSADRGASWAHSSAGLAYALGDVPVTAAWSLAAAHGRLWVGVEPAGLFVSDDGGATFGHVAGLREHPSRPHWQPGGGGLILHAIVPHARDPKRLWVGISTAGVFHTADGGATFEPRNRGTRADYLPPEQRFPEVGQCVHALAAAAGMPERLYQQSHCGMYRSDDGGRSWISIEAGLPSSFGFPVATHPRDPGTAWLVPLNGDSTGRHVPGGAMAVWRTRDAGASWAAQREGLPHAHAYLGVLRRALATDRLAPAGVYVGTTSGSLFASADEGASWAEVARHLPAILAVETLADG